MLDFPDSPTVDEVFGDWRWDGIRWVGVPRPVVAAVDPQCGRLVWQNQMYLSLIPFKGDQVKVAGSLAQIPPGLMLSSIGSGLTASTLYYVYFDGEVLTASTTPHVADDRPGNDGIHIMEGSPGQSLVGMAFTEVTGTFADTPAKRYVASWFNPRPRSVMQTLGGPFTPGSGYLQYGPDTAFLSWKNVPFSMGFYGNGIYSGTFNMGVRILATPSGSPTIVGQLTVTADPQLRSLLLAVGGTRDLNDGLNIYQMQANCVMGTRSLEDTAFNGMTVI